MENNQNIISSQTKLSAIVGMMFFAPIIKNTINDNSDLSEDEKDFITSYIKVGFVNLIFLVITLVAALIKIFWSHPILSRIIIFGSFAVYIITIFSLFACISELTMRRSDEKVVSDIQHKGQILKVYTPVLNFIIWFRQENYNTPYRRLKESILLRTIFIFGTLLLGSLFGIGVLTVIIIRISLLMLNIDIIPLSIKKAINSMFSCNPGEMVSYIFAPIVSKLKKTDYETVLNARKSGYAQGQVFGIGIIIQYLLFFGIIYLIYCNIVLSGIQIILIVAAIFRLIRVIIFYIYKKAILRIPILSEIVSLVFH